MDSDEKYTASNFFGAVGAAGQALLNENDGAACCIVRRNSEKAKEYVPRIAKEIHDKNPDWIADSFYSYFSHPMGIKRIEGLFDQYGYEEVRKVGESLYHAFIDKINEH